MKKMKNVWKNNKGMQLLELIIVIAIVASIAITTVPKINSKISTTLDNSMDKVDDIDVDATE